MTKRIKLISSNQKGIQIVVRYYFKTIDISEKKKDTN